MAEIKQGGATPPFGNFKNKKNTNKKATNKNKKLIELTDLSKSRKLAQRKAHNRRLKALYTRNKNKEQKKSFFKSLKNKPTGRRTLFLKGKSRAAKRNLESMTDFKEQMDLEKFLALIRNKKEDEMRESAENYYTEIAKGSEKSTQEGKKKREGLRNAYKTAIAVETHYREKIAPYDEQQPNFETSNNAQEYKFDVSMEKAAKIARESAAKIIALKVKEVKEASEKTKEKPKKATAVAVEIDELEDLLKSLKM